MACLYLSLGVRGQAGVEVVLERDDAGEFRAILPEGSTGKPKTKKWSAELLMFRNHYST
jgi:hypothetical protein